MKHCGGCKLDFSHNRKFCEFCGSALIDRALLASTLLNCSNCNEPIQPEWKFCKHCSARLTPSIQNPESRVSVQSAPPTPATVSPTGPAAGTRSAFHASTAPPKVVIRCRSCRHLMEEDVAFCESCGANMMEGSSLTRSCDASALP